MMRTTPPAIVLAAGLAITAALAALACSRPPASERSPTASTASTAPAPPVKPSSAGAGGLPCPAHVDAARTHLVHAAAWRKGWSGSAAECKEACVVHEGRPPDADLNIYRYHLVVPARGGGFDVLEDVALGREPERCGQFSAWETVVGGEPLHVRVTHLISAGIAFDEEIDDAGEKVTVGFHCAREGSESDLTDFFIDRARHARALTVTQHSTGEDDAEVTAAGGKARIHGAGCDEQRPLGGQP
jgi:hypothetical protein